MSQFTIHLYCKCLNDGNFAANDSLKANTNSCHVQIRCWMMENGFKGQNCEQQKK